jgi:hypothetical protein
MEGGCAAKKKRILPAHVKLPPKPGFLQGTAILSCRPEGHGSHSTLLMTSRSLRRLRLCTKGSHLIKLVGDAGRRRGLSEYSLQPEMRRKRIPG